MMMLEGQSGRTSQKVYRLGATHIKSALPKDLAPRRTTRSLFAAEKEVQEEVFATASEEIYESSEDFNELNNSPRHYSQIQKTTNNFDESSKSRKRSGPKALLNLLSNQIENENEKPRIRAGKNRDNLLYSKLNLLMAGKELQGAAGARQTASQKRMLEQDSPYHEYIDEEEDEDEEEVYGMESSGLMQSSLCSLKQKISQSLLKANEKVKKAPKLWNTKRDIQLMKLYKMYGEDWEAIAEAMNIPELTPELIEERYNYRIYSNISKPRFTLKEDRIIAYHYSKVGPNWKKINEFLPGRTEAMIKNRFNSKIKKKNLYSFLKQHEVKETEGSNFEEPYIESTASGNNNSTSEKRRSSELDAENETLEEVDAFGKYIEPSKKVKKCIEEINVVPQESEIQRLSSPLRSEIQPSPFVKPFTANMDQDYWNPYSFGNDFELDRKETHDFIDFEKIMDNFMGEQAPNHQNQEKYVDLLDFKETETFEMREHPLAPIMPEGRTETVQFQTEKAAQQPEFDELTAAAKFTQLQTLLSQIKSIEMLFDRTKQEISKLQSSYMAK